MNISSFRVGVNVTQIFFQTLLAGVGEETWLEKSVQVYNCSTTFLIYSIGWEIVEIMLTRTKVEFGLNIYKDWLNKDLLRERKSIIRKIQ